MHLLLRRPSAVAALALALVTYAWAASPTFWTLENQADFLPGEADGVSIASDGTISLAPATQVLYEPTDPLFWRLLTGPQGNLYVGSGNDGKIYRIEASGNATVLADTNELEVHALALDREGNLYAGTSPRGRVYRIGSDGTQEVFFDPDDRYIWAMETDSAGNLLVATGDNGVLYRVSRSGQAETLFTSQETHLVSLALSAEGDIYAGSDSNGLIFKIEASGRVSVLYDTPFREVRALVVDSRGNVYAAAVNAEPGAGGSESPETPTPPPLQTPTPAVSAGGDSVTVTVTATPVLPPTGASGGSGGTKGAVYRINPQGAAEQLWSSQEDLPFALRLERDDRLMVGTGRNGRVFLVSQDKSSSLLLRLEADQITSIASSDDGTIHFATANPAKIYRLSSGRRAEGVYRSPIKDTQTTSSWGKIRWEARTPAGTGLTVQTRSGNSEKPDNTWSGWSTAYTMSDGEQITSPKGRFFQWRAVFKSGDGQSTAELLALTAVYLPQNLPPEVAGITIHPPGQTFQKPLTATAQLEIMGTEEPLDSLDVISPTGNGGAMAAASAAASSLAFTRKFYRKGFQTVTWSASDPNDDQLRFDVFYRAEGQSLWRPLRQNLSEPVIAWDTVAMPDGRYALKIVANDGPSNPTSLAASGERESRSFDVDNTPPRIVSLTAEAEGNGQRVRFQAVDDSSPVQKVEYALDSGTWAVVYPTDGISDSKREDFDFTVSGVSEGVHMLVVKVTDLLNNVATARVELRR